MRKIFSLLVAVAALSGLSLVAGPATPAQAYVCGTYGNDPLYCGSVTNGSESLIPIVVEHRSAYPVMQRTLVRGAYSRYVGIRDAGYVILGPGQCARKRVKVTGGYSPWGPWIYGPARVAQGRQDTYWNALAC